MIQSKKMSRKDHALLVIILMFLAVSIVFGLQLKNTLHAQQSPNPSMEAKPAISVKQENLNPQLSPSNNLGNNDNSGNEPHNSQPINNGHSSSSNSGSSSSHGGTSSGGGSTSH